MPGYASCVNSHTFPDISHKRNYVNFVHPQKRLHRFSHDNLLEISKCTTVSEKVCTRHRTQQIPKFC